MPDRQTLKVASLYAIGVFGALGLTIALVGPANRLGVPAPSLLIIASAVWAMWFAGMAWRRTDEAAREAHKFAALWGAPFAMVILMLALPLIAITVFHVKLHPAAQLFTAAREHWGLIMAGVVLAGVVQIVGYGVAWTGWWLKHR